MLELLLISAVGAAGYITISTYNTLKAASENVKSRRANIMAVTKKRADLAQRLANIAMRYGDHEKLSQLQISEDFTSIGALMAANQSADQMINRVSHLATAFPDLKANQTYQQLMAQLEQIENDILERRESYNEAVKAYNICRVRFPQSLIANFFNFAEAPYYEVSETGLDELPEFHAGDSEALNALVQRTADRAQELANRLKTTAQSLEQRHTQSLLDTPAADAHSANPTPPSDTPTTPDQPPTAKP